MKKTVLTSLFLLLTLKFAFAQSNTSQNPSIELSTPFPVVDSFNKNYASNDQHIVSVKVIGDEVFSIQSFNKNTLKQIGKNQLTTIDLIGEKYGTFESLIEVNKRFYLFISLFNKKEKTDGLYKLEIDATTAKPLGTPEKIISVDGVLRGMEVRLSPRKLYKFQIETTETSNKTIIHYTFESEAKITESHQKTVFHVFNENLKEEWKREYEMPKTEDVFKPKQFLAHNDNTLFMLAKITGESRDHYSIFVITKDTPHVTEKQINLKNNFVYNARLALLKSGQLVLGGFYIHPNHENGAHGSFLLHLDNNGSTIKESQNEIPHQLIVKNESNQEVSKINKAKEKGEDLPMSYLEVNGIKELKDGSILVLGEQHEASYQSGYNGGIFLEHKFKSILLTKFAANGNLLWMNKISKNQTGAVLLQGVKDPHKLGTSFHFVEGVNNHHILFFDNHENTILTDDQTPAIYTQGKPGVVMQVSIDDKKGDLVRKAAFDLNLVNQTTISQLWMNRYVELNNSEIAFEAYKKKNEDIWIRLKLK